MSQFSAGMWVITPEEKSRHESTFNGLGPVSGKINGDQAKKYFMMSNLPTPVLGKIWSLADMDGDGKMTMQEFTIAMHLIQAKLRGVEVPSVLPYSLKSSSVPLKVPSPSGYNSSWSQTLLSTSGGPVSNGVAGKGIVSQSFFGPSGIGGAGPTQPPLIGTGTGFSLSASVFPNSGTNMAQPLNPMPSSSLPTMMPVMPQAGSAQIGMGMPISVVATTSSQQIARAQTWNQKTSLASTSLSNRATSSVKLPHSTSAPASATMTGLDLAFGTSSSVTNTSSTTSVGNVSGPSNISAISPSNRLKYTQMFKAADNEQTGQLSGEHARQILIQSNVAPQQLASIWELSDINKDGSLDLDEFIIAMHLIDFVKSGQTLPPSVPQELIPPNKRLQRMDSSSDARSRSESTSSGKDRSLSIGGADKMNPATFEDRRKENFEKGRLELERRRRELQDRLSREKEERERKEREEEERKRRAREEAERRRQQEVENERRQREEMEREQEALRKKMIEQRLAAQLEAERQRQREWEQRRKEELLNQMEHEEEVVSGLKARLEKLKGELNLKTSNRNQLAVGVESHRAEGSKLMEAISLCNRSSELKKSEMTQIQSAIQQSRVSFSSLKEERERLTMEINKRDTTTTSEALGGIRSSIHQTRNAIPRLKSGILSTEADTTNCAKELASLNNQLKALRESMQVKSEENSQQRQVLEQKKREYLMFRQRLEDENRRKREEEERQRREIEAKKRREEQLRRQLEEEARKQKQREEAAMVLEEQHQRESLRRIQEAQQSERRKKMEDAKKQAEEALKKQMELKQKETLRSQDLLVQTQQDALTNIKLEVSAAPRLPPPRKDKKSAPPRPTAPPRPSGPPKVSMSELSDVFSSINLRKEENEKANEEEAVAEKRKQEMQEMERKRKEEEKRKEAERRIEEERRREEEKRKEEERRKEEEARRKREEDQRKQEDRTRKENERLAKEEEEKRKLAQQAEIKRQVEEMQRKKQEKKQQSMKDQTREKEKEEVLRRGPPSRFKMLFPFEARNPDELSLEENDVVQVDENDPSPPPGWLKGTRKGKSGFFPANYAEKLPPDSYSDYVELDPKAMMSVTAIPPVTPDEPLVMTSPSDKVNATPPQATDPPSTATPAPAPAPKPKPKPAHLLQDTAPAELPTPAPIVSSGAVPSPSERVSSPYSSHKPEIEQDDDDTYVEMHDIYAVPSKKKDKHIPELTSPEIPDARSKSYENFHANFEKEVKPPSGNEVTLSEALQVVALYAYRGKKDDHLSFNKNDTIIVNKQQDMWWFGECGTKTGWFPKSYVKITKTLKAASLVAPDDKENSDAHSVASTGSSSSALAASSELLGASYEQLAASNEQLADDQSVIGECVAIFDYSGQEGDLSFCQGDTISITKMDTEWWEGYCNGHYGLFPANYVQMKEPETVKKKPEVATVISPFSASGSTEISLNTGNLIHVIRKNPSGWWQGELQAKGKKRQIGWFPASHVKLLGQGKPQQKEQPIAPPAIEVTHDQDDVYAVPQSQIKSQTEISDQVLAIYSYTAQNEDELTFYKGSVLSVINKEGEWWKGEFNGQIGMFPSNYVQLLSDLPDTTAQWFGSFDSAVLESMNETERNRQNYIYELINTEQRYMDDLSLTLEIFYNPMAEAKILKQEELNTVFVNWKELIMCNMKLLKAMLVRKKMSPCEKIEAIGDILVEQLPRLTPYIRFCSCQLKACKFLQFKVENDPEFKQFEKKCAGDPRLKQNLPLSSYLLKPLQRLTKYPLMIKQIMKYTPVNHYDRQNLELAVEKAEELCSKVNENIRLLENSERLEWLQSHVNLEGLGEKLVFNSHTNCLGQRKFLHYSTLFKHKSNKELKAFLFNDFLLLCRDHGSNAKARPFGSLFIASEQNDTGMQLSMYKKPIFLNEVVVKMPVEPEVNDTLFYLSHIDRIYIFRTESKNERNSWVSKLQHASEEFIETERLQRQKASRARSVLGSGVGKLLVTVIEGADLQSADPTGTSDPYCEVSMGSQEHKTKVIPRTLNPKWNSQMQFTVKDFDRDVLCITVFDRDFFSPNDFLGRTEISVSKLLAEGNGPWMKRLLLHEVDTGEILVRLEVQKFHTS